jgi:uncharacterized LabA/DUF88 family protein
VHPRDPVRGAERVAVFIDGWNFAKVTYEGLGIRVDFKRLLTALVGERILVHAIYYVGEWPDEGLRRPRFGEPLHPPGEAQNGERRRLQQQGFIRMLNRNGYQVVRKPVTALADGSARVDIGVELAIDMLTLADRCDREILVSGERDFVPLVRAVGSRGVRVQVVGSQLTAAFNSSSEHPRMFPARASDELLDAADDFTEVRDLVPHIELIEPRRTARPFVPAGASQAEELSAEDGLETSL